MSFRSWAPACSRDEYGGEEDGTGWRTGGVLGVEDAHDVFLPAAEDGHAGVAALLEGPRQLIPRVSRSR